MQHDGATDATTSSYEESFSVGRHNLLAAVHAPAPPAVKRPAATLPIARGGVGNVGITPVAKTQYIPALSTVFLHMLSACSAVVPIAKSDPVLDTEAQVLTAITKT